MLCDFDNKSFEYFSRDDYEWGATSRVAVTDSLLLPTTGDQPGKGGDATGSTGGRECC